jgi:predicted Rossmann fold nucleotide-binding protein DprA/Smf involved in DNA uptake
MSARARTSDPATSHGAARNAAHFADSHKDRIMAALKEGPRTAAGLAAMTGLTVVQIDRRAVELERSGRIAYVTTDDGQAVAIGGFRIWKAVR